MSMIEPIKVPKWGLSMEEGTIVEWHVSEGDRVAEGGDIVDIETTKITNVCQAHTDGFIRKVISKEGDTIPVGGLIAVMAEPDVSDSDIDAFISSYEIQEEKREADTSGVELEIRHVDIGNNRTLRVSVAGENQSGTPVILIHGYGGDLENWSLVMAGLAPQVPVYAIEMPGHGQSTKSVGEGKLSDLVEAIITGIEKIDLAKFILCGHSLGGAVACAASQKFERKLPH